MHIHLQIIIRTKLPKNEVIILKEMYLNEVFRDPSFNPLETFENSVESLAAAASATKLLTDFSFTIAVLPVAGGFTGKTIERQSSSHRMLGGGSGYSVYIIGEEKRMDERSREER